MHSNNYIIQEINKKNKIIYNFFKKNLLKSKLIDKVFFNWRNVQSLKSSKTSLIALGIHDEGRNLLGLVQGIPGSYIFNGQIIDFVWPVDFVISKELRGKGIGRKLIKSITKIGVNVIGLGGSKIAINLYKKLGWKITRDVETLIYVLDLKSYYKENKSILRLILYIYYFKIKPNFVRFKNCNNNIYINQSLEFTNDMNQLLLNNNMENTVVMLRPKVKIDWLCESPPFEKTLYFKVKNNKKLIGYFIIRIDKNEQNLVEGKILDIFCVNMNIHILNFILLYIKKRFVKMGVQLMKVMASHPSLKYSCSLVGFKLKNKNPIIQMTKFPFENKNLNWHITMIDSDFSYR